LILQLIIVFLIFAAVLYVVFMTRPEKKITQQQKQADAGELLKKVRKIEIKTKGLSSQLFSGDYSTAFKGRGMSFAEVREYQYGDDVRSIDWNVTARFNSPYVKVFEEERELTVMLMVDVSESAFFGTKSRTKNELITEITAVISFSAVNNNDKVGLILFSDKVEKFISPKKGRSHILRIIRELLAYKNDETRGTDLNEALRYFSNMMKKRSIVFLVSDFQTDGYQQALGLVSRRHDLIGIHVSDPREEELENVGLMRARDAESGKSFWLDTGSKKVRTDFAKSFRENYQRCKETFNRSGADLISITTDQERRPYVKDLMGFFRKRGR